MNNFLELSKDLYFRDQTKFTHFDRVLKRIQQMSYCKNYYETDLTNIEEILSILEMEAFVEGKELDAQFIDYIKDVIKSYTPEIQIIGGYLKNIKQKPPVNWESTNVLFGVTNKWPFYMWFFSNIFYLNFQFHVEDNQILATRMEAPETRYSIITLNYDMVVEKARDFLNQHYLIKDRITLNEHSDIYDENWLATNFTKLHGSVDSTIVPPTWSKGNSKEISSAWELAYKLLRDANQIRIIGYSLPTTDTYVKYLLKSAVLGSEHLRKIDVYCLDDDKHTVESRYDDFIIYKNYKYHNKSVEQYLDRVKDYTAKRDHNFVRCYELEKAHVSV